MEYQIFQTLGETKIVLQKTDSSRNGVKLQCLTEEREMTLVRVIGRFEQQSRVQEIRIRLYPLFNRRYILNMLEKKTLVKQLLKDKFWHCACAIFEVY